MMSTESMVAMRFLDKIEEGGRRRIMFMGATDTGKTHLVLAAAEALCEGGRRVGVLDFDLGQSTVGPPGCVGLQLPWEKGMDPLFPTAMVFLGFLSPAFDVGSVIEAGLRLEKRATEWGYEVLLVDTSGMVEGGLAGLLKRSKIRALRPDLLVLLEREGEMEHIFRGLERDSYGGLVKLKPSPEARSRSREERSAYRRERFRRYFRAPHEMILDLERVEVVATSPRLKASAETLREGHLLGLNDAEGCTRALARVLSIEDGRARLLTPYDEWEEEITSLAVGPSLLEEDGSLRLNRD